MKPFAPMSNPENRNKDGTFKEGTSGNPGGRPKNSLKAYVRQRFENMSDEQKEKFLESIPNEIIWKMGEGNPKQDTSVELTDGEPGAVKLD